MPRFDPGLLRTQRWMQDAILTPGPVAGVPRMILPSKTLEPLERLDIYRNMYVARLQEALEVDYPALLEYLGGDMFSDLIALYLKHNPSRSYTLNRLGDRLPDFVRRLENVPRPGFAHDIARMELAMTEVVDEEETPALTPDAIAAVPANAWTTVRLRPVKALRLLALRYPVNDYLNAIWASEPMPRLARKNTWLAISRRNYTLARTPLTGPAFHVLSALIEGRTLAEALAGRRLKQDQLFAWFRDWVAAGIFHRVEL